MDPATARFPAGTALPTLHEIPGLSLLFDKQVPANVTFFVALVACWLVWILLVAHPAWLSRSAPSGGPSRRRPMPVSRPSG